MSISAPRSPAPAADAIADTDEERVGYKKPPKGAQWKPGQSGNPRGRPKGAKSLTTILGDELDKPIAARVGGRMVSLTHREALVRKLIEQALKGDPRALMMLIKLDPLSAKDAATADAGPDAPLSAAQAAVLQGFLGRIAEEGGESPS